MDVLAVFLLLVISAHTGAQTVDPLNAIIEDKERIVTRIAEKTLEAFTGDCSYNCSKCAVLSCGSLLPLSGVECTLDYGAEVVRAPCEKNCSNRRLNFRESAIRTASPNITQQVVTEECLTRSLDSLFVDNWEDDSSTLRWQYVSTPSGFFRLYPAQAIERCHDYDPRIRPWYVAATSGPKDVVLIIDVSTSMLNYRRLVLAQEAAITVIQTLTSSDFVTVVVFNETAKQLLIPEQANGTLIRATYDNIEALSEVVSNIKIESNALTNFEAAFNLAFDILNTTGRDTSNCHTAILFLTDGHPNKGKTSQDYFECLVKERSQNAVIFTYTLGAVRAETAAITKGIACASNGIYAHVDDGGNLREQLSQYYDYFASLRRAGDDAVTWVEPYEDYAGAGLLVTASKAIYNFEFDPARLVGVAAVDIQVDNLQMAAVDAELNFSISIQQLASRNTCPRIDIRNLSICELNLIRESGGGEICDSNDSCDETSSSEVCTLTPVMINYCNYREDRYLNDSDVFRDEVCCLSPTELAELPGTCHGIESAKVCCLSTFIAMIVFAVSFFA